MASQASISINDAESTPVSHTFTPEGAGWDPKIGGIAAKWVDISATAAIGYWRLGLSFKRPTGSEKNYRVNAKTTVPVLETLSGSTLAGIVAAPSVAYVLSSETKAVLPERSTLQARKNANAIHKGFLANAAYTDAVESLIPAT